MSDPTPARGGAQIAAPPDLATIAREAVVGFLSEASADSAEREPELAAPPGGGDLMPALADLAAPADVTLAPSAAAERAAAVSVAVLDRIEAAAGRLEADIAAARQEQAELRVRAGAAAERAVLAAQQAWESAVAAEESSQQAGRKLRLIGGYTVVIAVLALVQLLILVLFAATTR